VKTPLRKLATKFRTFLLLFWAYASEFIYHNRTDKSVFSAV